MARWFGKDSAISAGLVGVLFLGIGAFLEYYNTAPNLPGIVPAVLAAGWTQLILISISPAIALIGIFFAYGSRRGSDPWTTGLVFMITGLVLGIFFDALGGYAVGAVGLALSASYVYNGKK